jgi:microcystin-dependent protein
MSDAYIGEIRMFAGSFAPNGWAFCDGALQSIAQNSALFSLLGTTYGGDGRTTFALPDLRGRSLVGAGQGSGLSAYQLGERGGVEQVTLTVAQLPPHEVPTTSALRARSVPQPGASLATGGAYAAETDANTFQAPVGGSQPHENMPPFLVVNWIIALFGIFPPRA